MINLGGIVYIGLDSLSDYEVAAAVGNSMFADLTSVAGSLYKFGTGRGFQAKRWRGASRFTPMSSTS